MLASVADVRFPSSDRRDSDAVVFGHRASAKNPLAGAAATATFPEAVQESEEVVPVNVSTWVLPSGVTAGR
ncbi:hypothetical protein FGW37_00170 [Streptomyces rectiverticillatus]|nr:hypothetical protein FGW37_00170 [Streptomyces rectiverticillatus]